MKRVIGGKMYNTDTAQLVASATSGGSTNDFAYWKEGLYRTKSGKFFLVGEGGAMTQYASSCGNSTGYGEHMRPMVLSEALGWLEKRNVDAETLDLQIEEA